jgi:outer membrane protein OmpA-like peptidoglycan-associated protein
MRSFVIAAIATLVLAACGGGRPAGSPGTASIPGAEGTGTGADPASGGAPAVDHGDSPKNAHGATPSKIKATETEAAMKFVVVDAGKGPIEGVVVALTDPEGNKFYTEETDATGYAEVLVPVGAKYDVVFLSIGKREIVDTQVVEDKPRQTIRFTLIYKGLPPRKGPEAPRFVLDGVNFDTGKATIRPESYPRLDGVVEYLEHKPGARIEISGHTDNVGNAKANKALSEKRAKACREYMVSKGIDAGRIEAVGHGDERPVAPNDTAEGRQQNRRIEATEL